MLRNVVFIYIYILYLQLKLFSTLHAIKFDPGTVNQFSEWIQVSLDKSRSEYIRADSRLHNVSRTRNACVYIGVYSENLITRLFTNRVDVEKGSGC